MTRARTSIRRAAPSRPATHLESGLRAPVTRRWFYLLSRMAAMLAAAGLIELIVTEPDKHLAAGLLALAAALQPAVRLLPERMNGAAAQSIVDLAIVIGISISVPDLAPSLTIWLGSIIAWHALISSRQTAALIAAVAVAVTIVIGPTTGGDKWYYASISLALVAAALITYGHTLRYEFSRNEASLMDALTAAGALVHHSDLDKGTVVKVEGDVIGLTGWTPAEWTAGQHSSFIHPDDVDAYWVDVDDVTADTVIDRVARMRRKDGSWIWIRDIGRVSEDPSGRRTLRGFGVNVTELEEANDTIARQLREDFLTGLPNRLALNERLTDLLDAGDDFALLLTDLDRFKEINDTLGHEAGDLLLQAIARRLRSLVGPNDLVARLGGDEYAVVVVGASELDDVVTLANRLAAECARPMMVHGVDVAVTSSTGISFGSVSGINRATMMRHADIAMYDAKRDGEAYRVFDGSLEQTSTVRLSLSASLADAIERDEIVLYFQPQYDIITGELVGAEGLARWVHPEYGLLPPNAFLDLALVSENSVPFALRTIDHAAGMIRRLVDHGHAIPVAANVSMGTLRDTRFAAALLDTLARHEVSPDLLVLELTESDPLWPNPAVLSGLQSLVDVGVRLSIDDFGTGHSSLERLRSLRVHELKIDRSFVDGMVEDAKQREIVRSIVGLARGLGYGVVAEGVETDAQIEVLTAIGCSTAQGYLLGRPVAADELLAKLSMQPLSASLGG